MGRTYFIDVYSRLSFSDAIFFFFISHEFMVGRDNHLAVTIAVLFEKRIRDLATFMVHDFDNRFYFCSPAIKKNTGFR